MKSKEHVHLSDVRLQEHYGLICPVPPALSVGEGMGSTKSRVREPHAWSDEQGVSGLWESD